MEGIEQTASNVSQEGKNRSSSYPSLTVDKAYEFAKKINDQFSSVAEISREEIATALSMNAGSIIRDISSCVQYGFLNKNTAEGKYKLSQIFSNIFSPESERDKKVAYMKAFGNPKLYNELITKFENNVIPIELPNTLSKHFNIRKEVADNAANIFIESGKYVGVINDNRLLKYAVTLSTAEKSQSFTTVEEVPLNDNNGRQDVRHHLLPTLQVKNDTKAISIPIHLVGDKIAMFAYPEDITEDDIEIIKYQIEGILLRVKLSKKKGTEAAKNTIEDTEK